MTCTTVMIDVYTAVQQNTAKHAHQESDGTCITTIIGLFKGIRNIHQIISNIESIVSQTPLEDADIAKEI